METIQDFKNLWSGQNSPVDRSLKIWESAVLLPLIPGKNGWEILFEVRSSQIHWQPGDICFPGGHREKEDPTLLDTALRETSEELGIAPGDITVLGPLPYFYAYMGPIIYPYAGILPPHEKLTIQKEEVGEVFTVPLQDLLAMEPIAGDIEIGSRRAPDFPKGLTKDVGTAWRHVTNYQVYFYPWHDRIIWGITARVLRNFLEKVKSHK